MLSKKAAIQTTTIGSKAYFASCYSTVNINTMNIMVGRVVPTYGVASNSSEEASASSGSSSQTASSASAQASTSTSTARKTRTYPLVSTTNDEVDSVCGHIKV